MAPWSFRISHSSATTSSSNPLHRPPNDPEGGSIHVHPSPSRRTHSRSISNPFPSLFGARHRKDPLISGDPFIDAPEPANAQIPAVSQSTGPRRRPSQSSPAHGFLVQRCMTCDHSNSFPLFEKGFRCGKCATVNDLEPSVAAQSLQVPNVQHGLHVSEKVSLGRTRLVVDECILACLTNEMKRQTNENPASINFCSLSLSPALWDNHPPSNPSPLGGSETNASSPLSLMRTPDRLAVPQAVPRAPSNNSVENPESYLQEEPRSHTEPSTPHGEGEPESNDPRSLDRAAGSQKSGQALAEAKHASSLPAAIFRALEDLILASFDGCGTLNNSFLTPGSRHPRSASDGGFPPSSRAENPPGPVPWDAPMPELDEKTLRLGNVAENGSWWTGNRPLRQASIDARQQAESGSGRVSFKTPRINWNELSEWYRLVMSPGESWHTVWEEMKRLELMNPESPLQGMDWEETELLLEQAISKAQFHVQSTLLGATERLLLRPKQSLRQPEDIRFLLIILANPLLYSGNQQQITSSPRRLRVPRRAGYSRSEDGAMVPVHKAPSPRRAHTVYSRVSEPTDYRHLIVKRVIGLLSNLPEGCHYTLVSWFSRFSRSHFLGLVELVGRFVTYRLAKVEKRRSKRATKIEDSIDEFVPTFSSPGTTTAAQLHSALQLDSPGKNEARAVSYSDDWQIKAAARVMALLFRANDMSRTGPHLKSRSSDNTHEHKRMIPVDRFYNMLLDYTDLIADFEAWESRNGKFSFCQYSFFLSVWAKIRILEHDARRQMEAKAREAFFDNILGHRGASQYLLFKVRRSCLAEDSLRRVSEVVGSGAGEFRKGLRVEFVGEEGVDAGGLRKEWFLLLVREIFDPLHGLFLYDEDSQYCYFNPYCFESTEQFFLVGVLLGLAIYNSTILDIALPPFAFRKLLASAPSNNVPSLSTPPEAFRCTLNDLAEYRPSLAKGLQNLLEYDGDVQETFCQDFVIQIDRYGEAVEVPLCPGGENRAVTNANRREFVDLYVKYLLDTAVARQFEPFTRGFYSICGGNALHLFRPEEIELLVRGSDEPLDISSLRAVARYENWPMAKPEREPVIVWFWEFFGSASPKDQRKILSFITGSDRIPAMGAVNLFMRIVCSGQDSERLPTARTCFNMLSLCRYRTRERFESKLWQAVTESEGFGFK